MCSDHATTKDMIVVQSKHVYIFQWQINVIWIRLPDCIKDNQTRTSRIGSHYRGFGIKGIKCVKKNCIWNSVSNLNHVTIVFLEIN